VLLSLAGLVAAGPAAGARLVEVRIGEYESFTRVVFELDGPAGYRLSERELPDGGRQLEVTLAVASSDADVPTRSARLRSVSLQNVQGAYTRVRLVLADPSLRLREMVLQDPARLVVDLLVPAAAGAPGPRAGDDPAWIERTAVAAAPPPEPAPSGASPPVPPGGPPSPAPQPPPPERLPAPGPEPTLASEATPGPEPDAAGEAVAGSAPEPPAPAGEPAFPVTGFELVYAEPHPEHPALEEVGDLALELGRVPDGFVAVRDGVPPVEVRLADGFSAPGNRFYASAIRSINQQLVGALNRRGYVGVLVEPDPNDIARRTGEDLRAPERTALRLVIWTGRVRDIRSFASGQRVPEDERLDNPAHARILDRSPVRPDGTHDLMRKDVLDDYVARLNRHPGRRVDVLISPAREPGGAYLDYLVSEFKPWYAYAALSNTGTENTTDLRQRFSFTHNQLTGHDDILAIDYVTGNFQEVNFVHGFYDVPIWGTDRFRGRAFGSWSEYDSSVLGFSGRPFQGDGWYAGGSLTGIAFQHRDFFVDLFAGMRWAHYEVKNDTIDTKGSGDFLLPQWGLHLQQLADALAFFADVEFEANLPGAAGTDLEEIVEFGRGQVDEDWVVMRWDSAAWFYLEPLIFREAWRDPSTPSTSTLAHEIQLSFRGQYAFGSRLIPQEMSVAGGLYSVRGYDEAVATGDTTLIGNVEYRLHVPRLLRPRKKVLQVPWVGDFRVVPQQVYGQPDWDLIFRVFFDVGRTVRNDRTTLETNETLLGAGLGLELVLKRNLTARFDYGWALETLENGEGEAGDGKAYFVVRLLY
jgi:hypothetical protein